MKKNSLNSVFRGFTLAEALVALLVITIIIAASLPIITKKKRSIDRVTHGAYACYWQNGQLIGRYLIDQKTATGKTYYDSTEGRYGCEFTPPAGAKNLLQRLAAVEAVLPQVMKHRKPTRFLRALGEIPIRFRFQEITKCLLLAVVAAEDALTNMLCPLVMYA